VDVEHVYVTSGSWCAGLSVELEQMKHWEEKTIHHIVLYLCGHLCNLRTGPQIKCVFKKLKSLFLYQTLSSNHFQDNSNECSLNRV